MDNQIIPGPQSYAEVPASPLPSPSKRNKGNVPKIHQWEEWTLNYIKTNPGCTTHDIVNNHPEAPLNYSVIFSRLRSLLKKEKIGRQPDANPIKWIPAKAKAKAEPAKAPTAPIPPAEPKQPQLLFTVSIYSTHAELSLDDAARLVNGVAQSHETN